MPNYLIGAQGATATQISQILNNSGINIGDNLCEAFCDAKFIGFIGEITDRLQEVVVKQRDIIEDLKTAAYARQSRGTVLAEITVPKQMVGVKLEYVLYIDRYGPPLDGLFNKTILDSIRAELGIAIPV